MDLMELQTWFGKIISQTPQEDYLLTSESESAKYISPSATLQPHERLQIYHQQYWWRLIKCLQSNFPALLRLFGNKTFASQLAIPYLRKNPPKHWALHQLGDTLPEWLEQCYHETDHYFVITTAKIDWAAQKAFWIGNIPPVDFAQFSVQETYYQYLILQPSIQLFKLQGNFFLFREALLKQEPDYYNAGSFPPMDYGEHHFVLYRTEENVVTWEKISSAMHWMLSQFKSGNTIKNVCAALEREGEEMLDEATSQIPFWFKQWTVRKWFGSLSSS